MDAEKRQQEMREYERISLQRRLYTEYQQARTRRIFIWFIAGTGTVYFLSSALIFYFKNFSSLIASISLSDKIIALLTILAGIGAVMFSYLDKSKVAQIRSQLEYFDSQEASDYLGRFKTSNTITKDEIEARFGMLAKLITQQGKAEPIISLTQSQKDEVYNSIVGSISNHLTEDFFDNLKEKVKAQIVEDKRAQLAKLVERSESSIRRLRNEVELLSRRANTNLVIGSIVTLSALAILTYFVVNEDFNSSEIVKVALHFLPRLSLVIFIEFFSFFFLKLYRASLHEIKYYQNELTNLETKAIAVAFTANYGSESDISNIVQELSTTERNFKLQKGESTVELERNKLETHDLKEVLKAALGAAQKKKE